MPSAPAPLNVFFSPAYVVPGGIETTTKSGIIARMIEEGRAGDVRLRAPNPATRAELERIHSPEHVRRTFEDHDRRLEVGPWSQAALDSILASTGGVRDAMKVAMRCGRSGSLSSGLHHASYRSGRGFCQFNGLALAALDALRQVATVGILDLDAHAGGGTFDILGDRPQVFLADVTVCPFDTWEPTDPTRHHYVEVEDARDYLPRVEEALGSLDQVDFLIYNAGMDAHERAGGLRGIDRDIICRREQLVVEWARSRKIPHIFALAGGYKWDGLTLEEVAELHLETIKAFAA